MVVAASCLFSRLPVSPPRSAARKCPGSLELGWKMNSVYCKHIWIIFVVHYFTKPLLHICGPQPWAGGPWSGKSDRGPCSHLPSKCGLKPF